MLPVRDGERNEVKMSKKNTKKKSYIQFALQSVVTHYYGHRLGEQTGTEGRRSMVSVGGKEPEK